jgi:hypothetical protein
MKIEPDVKYSATAMILTALAVGGLFYLVSFVEWVPW